MDPLLVKVIVRRPTHKDALDFHVVRYVGNDAGRYDHTEILAVTASGEVEWLVQEDELTPLPEATISLSGPAQHQLKKSGDVEILLFERAG